MNNVNPVGSGTGKTYKTWRADEPRRGPTYPRESPVTDFDPRWVESKAPAPVRRQTFCDRKSKQKHREKHRANEEPP